MSAPARTPLALLALLAVALVALLAWALSGDPPDEPDVAGAGDGAAPVAPGPAAGPEPLAGPTREAPEAAPDASPEPEAGAVLRGAVELPPGAEAPARWTLVIEPSRALLGPDTATGRRVELRGDELEFEVTGLAHAGYSVRAEAEGMNGHAQQVLLAPPVGQAYVVLQLYPAGPLTGRVLDEAGGVVDGLALTLDPVADGRELEAATDANGRFAFEGVLDGEYVLRFGSVTSPVADPLPVSFRAPGVQLETVRVPELLSLDVVVVDDLGRPVEGVSVRGTGSRGGLVDVVSDARGRARALLLRDGRYRLRARAPDERGGFAVAVVERGAENAVEVVLQR